MERINVYHCFWKGICFLELVDSFTNHIMAWMVNSTYTEDNIPLLEVFFRLYGYPKVMISDNGPPFSSAQYKQYCINRNIKLLNTPPYHQACNGLAENGVQTLKLFPDKNIWKAINN